MRKSRTFPATRPALGPIQMICPQSSSANSLASGTVPATNSACASGTFPSARPCTTSVRPDSRGLHLKPYVSHLVQ
jgi:hypothetical protein